MRDHLVSSSSISVNGWHVFHLIHSSSVFFSQGDINLWIEHGETAEFEKKYVDAY